jgi:hypothetical protein
MTLVELVPSWPPVAPDAESYLSASSVPRFRAVALDELSCASSAVKLPGTPITPGVVPDGPVVVANQTSSSALLDVVTPGTVIVVDAVLTCPLLLGVGSKLMDETSW